MAIETLETGKNSNLLFELLKALNDVNKFFYIEMCKELKPQEKEKVVREIFNTYLNFLKKYSFVIGNIAEAFRKEYRRDFQKQLLDHWNKSVSGYSPDEKTFIEIFDDMHNISILKYPQVFTVMLRSLKHLYRAQRGQHYGDYDRMIPKPQYVLNKNRWNPEGIAFQYLGYAEQIVPYDGVINMIEKACSEEIRLKAGEMFTSCKFKPTNNIGKIINFCWQDLDLDNLEAEFDDKITELSQKEVRRILNKRSYNQQLTALAGTEELKSKIWEIIDKEANKPKEKEIIKSFTEIHIAKILMKAIDETVFLPVEQEEDPELKAYIPFHYLAEYLRGKGYAGVLFRSTRMDKAGLKGKNLVLFNTADAVPVKGSMNVYHYDGKNYTKINR
jgi:hypothetical protein